MTLSAAAPLGRLERRSLFDIYMHHTGTTEVPTVFHRWGLYALVAACLGDRVWVEKFAGEKLTPNLYTILLGPSGLGKGVAISTACKFAEALPTINYYRGKVTGPYLLDYMGRPSRNEKGRLIVAGAKPFLVTPELAFSVGTGDLAVEFFKMVTEVYTGGSYTLREGTRTHGSIEIRDPLINWLGGSTEEWLIEAIPRSAVFGGFFARVVLVEGHYNLKRRVVSPLFPADREDCELEIAKRITDLSTLVRGKIILSPEARTVEQRWYENRPEPNSPLLLPNWKREHDLMLKLAAIVLMCRSITWLPVLIIEAAHLIEAQQLVGEIGLAVPKFLEAAASTKETEATTYVRRTIRESKQISKQALLRKVSSSYGVSAKKLAEALDHLTQENVIETIPMRSSDGSGRVTSIVYRWRKHKATHLYEVEPPVVDDETADGEATDAAE